MNRSAEFDEAVSRLRMVKRLPSIEGELKRSEEFRLRQIQMLGEQA